MENQIKIRCSSCGKVLLAKPSQARKIAKCPRCGARFVIPSLANIAERKGQRVPAPENEAALARLSEKLTVPKEPPLCRVVYTEASPVQFALQRKKEVPLLDLSEDGLSFYMKDGDSPGELREGARFVVEIDFPVLIVPVYTPVILRWLKRVEEQGLYQLGVQFQDPDQELLAVVKTLVNFILSRPEVWELCGE